MVNGKWKVRPAPDGPGHLVSLDFKQESKQADLTTRARERGREDCIQWNGHHSFSLYFL